MSLTVDPLVPVRVVVEIAEVILPGHLKISSFTLEIPQTTSDQPGPYSLETGPEASRTRPLACLAHVERTRHPLAA